MQLNLGPGKPEMMILAVSAARRADLKQQHCFSLAGHPVRYVEQYLGCHVHERCLSGADVKPRASWISRMPVST